MGCTDVAVEVATTDPDDCGVILAGLTVVVALTAVGIGTDVEVFAASAPAVNVIEEGI